MCGIAGLIVDEGPDLAVLKRMTDTMAHRGPDDEGFWQDGRAALGQRRLSIIDIEGGHQPMSNEDGSVVLVCNGEIYNSPLLREKLSRSGHVFKTRTDVEVILHLYEEMGPKCVKKLRGMFGFAIWDRRTKTLMLARDHLGQKPVFFHHDRKGFAFASEVKGVLESGLVERGIDMEALWHYMSLRFIPDRMTLFAGVEKLPAASYLLYRNGKVSVERYWSLDYRDKLVADEREIEERLNELLVETVRMHLLSDVRVGAFLSGGIDSSTIAAIMARTSDSPIPTFSIGVKESGFNELPYAREVADRYGTEHHEWVVEADIVHLIPKMVWHMDEPSDPFGVGVFLVAKLTRQYVKVSLGGDGGDELFAGYDRFLGNRLADFYSVLPEWFRGEVMRRVAKAVPDSYGYKSLAQKIRWMNDMSFMSKGKRYAESMSFLRFTDGAKNRLFTERAKSAVGEPDSTEKVLAFFDAECVAELVDRMLYTDVMTRLPDHLLVILDRMSMAHSLEGRSPYVDYKVVEFAAAIPSRFKLKGRRLKYILRRVASRYLSRELITRRKQGFGFPLAEWMRNELSGFVRGLMKESRFVELGIFQEETVRRILDEHIGGKRDHNFRIWILINLEFWYRLFFEGQSVDELRELTDRLLVAKPA
ncbi:asparagine synthase (glutamine-hydrolyzing) [bacterium]|nr:asparagine synthase (glutamine-hydrolyzing) [bacterium]